MSTAGAPTPARHRARWPWVLLVIVVVLAVLAVGAEVAARIIVPNTVRSLVISQLDLPPDQPLDVETPGMMLPQLLSGELDEVHLASDDVTLGGITGAARVTATEVPVNGGALGSAKGTVSIDEKQFSSLLEASALPVNSLSLQEPNATLEGRIPLFGSEIPVGVTVTPGAKGGDLLLTPVSLSVNGTEVDLQALSSMVGGPAAQLAQPQRICIADRLPAGITLTGLRIEGSTAVADISADGRIAVDPALLENGTCPRP
ncbi:LmeA family phospholipid-binding protein [Microbacterium sp. USHLN186]|uniref:LmeA family phospholipid-binding protein n=1 Tax=Microbacterium sp. USHLN186 TaxID=3081286 RepID=UPI0030199CD5